MMQPLRTLRRMLQAHGLMLGIAGYGLVNALLYSSLLPLWEGFDEPFHYAYVQELSTFRILPTLGRSVLSKEVDGSLRIAPMSHVVSRTIPESITFSEFFSLDPQERAKRRSALLSLDPDLRFEQSRRGNYEAHQAPFAYVLLAMADRIWSESPLPVRIWRLRLLLSSASVLLAAASCSLLAEALSLGGPAKAALLFLVFSTQTYYATVCHVANDWLAVPVAFFLFAAIARLNKEPNATNAVGTGIALGVGLLTKAYFLAFVPLVFGLCSLRLIRTPRLGRRGAVTLAASTLLLAAPWYARNLCLHGSISGTVETVSGVGPLDVVTAIAEVDWTSSAAYMARGSLWTGNNHFSTFSRGTLNFMLFLLAFGFVAYVAKIRLNGAPPEEQPLLVGVVVYSLALGYVTTESHVFRHGESAGASVWYTQVLLAPAICIFLAGLSLLDRLGRIILAGTLLIWSYVMCATYLFKLIPLYGGYDGRANIGPLLGWYLSALDASSDPLSFTALASPRSIYGMLALCVAISAGISFVIIRLVLRNGLPRTPIK